MSEGNDFVTNPGGASPGGDGRVPADRRESLPQSVGAPEYPQQVPEGGADVMADVNTQGGIGSLGNPNKPFRVS